MKKRLISLALVLVLALSLLPVAALAADKPEYSDFTDLKENVWYTPYIEFVLEKGYFNGMSATEFAPNGNMTRAMFVTVIARMEGAEVDNTAATQFEDVKVGVWYTGSVAWAAENKIVEGYEDGSFRPGNNVTRREMAAIMERYINWRMAETGDAAVPGEDDVTFVDQAEIDSAAWAKAAVETCVAYGLLKGYPDGTFGGKRTSTRAEVAAVIERLDWIIHGKDHIYRAVLNITNDLVEVANKAAVKAEDLSAEYKDYITTLDEQVGDIQIADYIDTSIVVGDNVNGSRLVSVDGKAYLNENTVYALVKSAVGYAVTLLGEGNQVTYDGVKEIVDAVKADVEALNLGYLTEMEACEIAELVYSAVRGKVSDVWTSNFKGPKGYYTGDITIKVGDFVGTIAVDEETGATIPNWKSQAKEFGIALAKEVAKSFLAQAKEFTSSVSLSATVDITFSAGAYKADTDLYAYNYPVAVNVAFENEFDTIQYKVNDGVFVKAYISEKAQQGFKTAANTALDKIMESDAFNEKFAPAVEEVKDEQLAPVIDVLAKGEMQDEASANEVVDSDINKWAKANAESKLTGDGQWDNSSIYNLATLVGMEVNTYVQEELKAKGLKLDEETVTPELLKENMITAGVEFDVDPALENYVLAVICDEVRGEEKFAAEDGEYYKAMTEYVDETLPAAIEDNDNFNKALELVEKVRNALESVDNLSAVKFGNVTTLLRNDTIQDYLTYEKTDNLVAKFAKYVKKVPAKAEVVFAGCVLNEEAVIELKNAKSVADVCDILADIIEETGLADLCLADFEGGQDLVVSYGSKSATATFIVEFQK